MEKSNHNSINKLNFFKRVLNWFLSNKSSNLVAIIIAITPAFISYFLSTSNSNNAINIAKQDINQKINNNIVQKQECNLDTDSNNKVLGEKNINDEEKGFIKENWKFYKDMIPNEEGYYCPGSPGFPSWAIWTIKKYKADTEASITFSLLDKTNDNKNPTLNFSYGDKTNKTPDIFYKINILDGDLNTIRLYSSKDDGIFDRSSNDIPLDRYITFTVSPVFSGKSSSKLILNPSITYLVDGKDESYIPKKEFKIELPFTNERQGDGFQFAIGVSKGDCFKIISTNL